MDTSGTAYDLSGGSSYDVTVSSGGEELVANGAIDRDATLVGVIGSGTPGSSAIGPYAGLQIVSGLALSAVVSSGGYQEIAFDAVTLSAGEATSTTVLSGGVVEVDSGAVLNGAVLGSGAELVIYKRYDAVSELALAAGALIDLSNLTLTAASIAEGVLTISSGGQSIESFTLAGVTAGLGVSLSSDNAGGTILTVTSGSAPAAKERAPSPTPTKTQPVGAVVEAAATFGRAFAGVALAHALQSANSVTTPMLLGAERHALA